MDPSKFRVTQLKATIKKMINACRYLGFDPSVIMKRLIAANRNAMRAPTEEYSIAAEDGRLWSYSNQEDIFEDNCRKLGL